MTKQNISNNFMTKVKNLKNIIFQKYYFSKMPKKSKKHVSKNDKISYDISDVEIIPNSGMIFASKKTNGRIRILRHF